MLHGNPLKVYTWRTWDNFMSWLNIAGMHIVAVVGWCWFEGVEGILEFIEFWTECPWYTGPIIMSPVALVALMDGYGLLWILHGRIELTEVGLSYQDWLKRRRFISWAEIEEVKPVGSWIPTILVSTDVLMVELKVVGRNKKLKKLKLNLVGVDGGDVYKHIVKEWKARRVYSVLHNLVY